MLTNSSHCNIAILFSFFCLLCLHIHIHHPNMYACILPQICTFYARIRLCNKLLNTYIHILVDFLIISLSISFLNIPPDIFIGYRILTLEKKLQSLDAYLSKKRLEQGQRIKLAKAVSFKIGVRAIV